MRADGWSPRLQAGIAFTANRFSFVLGELEYDDPFSAIITYDGRVSQPWSRVDIRREIVDLVYDQDGVKVIALSTEGDVYDLHEDHVEQSKIIGAGVLSDDASGFGATHVLLRKGDATFVFGAGRQIYRRQDNAAWQVVSADATAPHGSLPEAFDTAVLLADGQILVHGVTLPNPGRGTGLTDHPEFDPHLSPEQLVDLMDRIHATGTGEGRREAVYLFDGQDLEPLDIPRDVVIRDLCTDPAGNVWIVGVNGLILRRNPRGVLERLNFHGDMETLLSAAWFDESLVLASDYGLHRFDGHSLTRIKPTLSDPFVNRNTPAPNRIQAVDGALVYFDYKHGVCRWDGKTWDWVNIPQNLLARDFGGLAE